MFVLASILSLVALIISVPIFLVFGLGSSIAAIGGLNLPWSVLIQVSFGALTKHVLIAVPLFIFTGMAMLKGGAASRLVIVSGSGIRNRDVHSHSEVVKHICFGLTEKSR